MKQCKIEADMHNDNLVKQHYVFLMYQQGVDRVLSFADCHSCHCRHKCFV